MPPAAAPPNILIRLRNFLNRTSDLQIRVMALENALRREQIRIDHALAWSEGIVDAIEAFHVARAGAEYVRAFTDTAPLVSVCVGTMNRAELLTERCLRSLREQTYRNLQIVVVGDHCTDETARRVAALGDERIDFFNLPHRGPYPPPGWERWCVAGTNSVNEALSHCEGAFIMHLDDDDRAVPERVETLLRAAQQQRADLCWHPFWSEQPDGTWKLLGNGVFELGQITTGSIFYHQYFARIPWDVHAYRLHEPGDWNRLRKIGVLRPRLHFVDVPLTYHYRERNQPPFEPQAGETFLG
jgi:glycosyltransferase involved in cell wall biosynthesis